MDHGLTAQVELTVQQLFRARGPDSPAATDPVRTQAALGRIWTPEAPCLAGGGPSIIKGCLSSWPSRPAGTCAVNGQADLEAPLPCPGPR